MIEINKDNSLLVFKKGYTPEFVYSIIKKNNLNGLQIFAHLNENRLENLDFLEHYSFLETLEISSVDDYNFNFLSALKELKKLSIIIDGKNSIDLCNQSNLKSLSIKWRKGKIRGLELCNNLKDLCLIEFNENDFNAIKFLNRLETLKVKTSLIKSLNGLEELVSLKELLFGNCKNLKSLNGIENIYQIKTLSFNGCPNVFDFSNIMYLTNIEKLEITDCKIIKSIYFIENLKSLKELIILGNSDIIDGDLFPAKKIENLVYNHLNHYNVKIENKSNSLLIKQNLDKIKRLFNR